MLGVNSFEQGCRSGIGYRGTWCNLQLQVQLQVIGYASHANKIRDK